MDKEVLTLLALALTLKKRRKKRAKWIKDCHLKRQLLSHMNLLKEMRKTLITQ
jgi:hypothetical protein